MKKVENMTKAELLEHLAQVQEAKDALEKEKEEQKVQIEADMSFAESPDERDARNVNQRRKDFIKRMTKGRWTSEKKYLDFQNQNRVRG